MNVAIPNSCPPSATAEQTARRARAHFIMGSRGQLPQTRHFTYRESRPSGPRADKSWVVGNSVENHLEPQARHDFHLYGWAAGPCVTRQ
jgi:hypothetical protein